MILDSSAVVAILLRQPGHEEPLKRIAEAPGTAIGTPTLAETGIVLTARLGPSGRSLVARFVEEADILALPFGESHWQAAIGAYLRFGKGRHPAALNYGDCMTYATAELAREPLLCVGEDFAQTDLELVR